MIDQTSPYRHTQRGPWAFLLAAMAVVMMGAAWAVWTESQALGLLLGGTGILMLLLAPSFYSLTVADEGESLAIRFGPLPVFRKRIHYADLRNVEIGRTTILEGFGIHLSLRGGWVWNIWGWDCVVLHHRGITRLGTNDAENLAAFLRTKISAVPESTGAEEASRG